MSDGLTYADAGVNIDAGNELVSRIAGACKATHRPELLTGLGGFAALAELPAKYQHPVIVTGTDGVGTKLKLAIDHDQHDSVGQDLVAMCVNDVIVTGAEPFLFLDYYATAALDVDTAERVIKGIAHGCELAGCALVGGETAEMPGFYQTGDYDLAGFCIGVVEKDEIVTGHQIRVGDRLLGLASSGPHSNGYSLIRKILERQGLGSTDDDLVQQLMAPTRIYAKNLLSLAVRLKDDQQAITGMSHITGGGLLENIPRMFTDSTLAACIDPESWQRSELFSWLQQAGNVAETEMLRTFNCGVGFVICVPAAVADTTQQYLTELGETVYSIGEIVSKDYKPRTGQILIG